jgi:hypothetical protein
MSEAIENYGNTATYCPEDNKLRLYVGRVPRDEYLQLRADGWKSTPKQDCDFVATWSPSREDTALEYADYIDDEDMSPAERAADRAERFGYYRDKRRAEAHDHADRFDAGPAVHGYQSQDKADRAANRHNRQRLNACTQWSKAEYWQTRTAGVISHALHVSSASVRRGRILKLEAEQRKNIKECEKYIQQRQHKHDVYNSIAGNRELILSAYWTYSLQSNDIEPAGDDGNYTLDQARLATAITMADSYSDKGKALIAGELDPVTYAKDWLADSPERPADYVPNGRWHNHYTLRIAYENQMLEAAGGKASVVEMIPGGFWDGDQIHRVNRSPVTKLATSLSVMAAAGKHEYSWQIPADAKPHLQTVNIERCGEGHYRAPTDEELEAFKAVKKGIQAETKKRNAGKPKLINPTNEDAERLQSELNDYAQSRKNCQDVERSAVWYMTQEEYKKRSGGSYSPCETRHVRRGPRLDRVRRDLHNQDMNKREIVCKVRASSSGSWYSAWRVVVITDKPQKPLPDWTYTEAVEEVTA